MVQRLDFLLVEILLLQRNIGLSLLLLLVSVFAEAMTDERDATKIAVIYPKVREPFDQVFLEIILGIREAAGAEINILKVDSKDQQQDVTQWLKTTAPKRIIALGRGGLKTAATYKSGTVVVGAVTTPHAIPDSFSSILLTPAPELLFEKLKLLAPHINEVSIVFHPQQDWLLQEAQTAADTMGLTLRTYEAATLRAAAKIYKDVLPTLPTNRAVWIVYGRLDNTLFAEILDTAWYRNLVVFSNNFSHVKQGVLFALYPDNTALGQSLAKLTLSLSGTERQQHLLKDVHTAVNLRTAGHLGLIFKKAEDYDIAFPTK